MIGLFIEQESIKTTPKVIPTVESDFIKENREFFELSGMAELFITSKFDESPKKTHIKPEVKTMPSTPAKEEASERVGDFLGFYDIIGMYRPPTKIVPAVKTEVTPVETEFMKENREFFEFSGMTDVFTERVVPVKPIVESKPVESKSIVPPKPEILEEDTVYTGLMEVAGLFGEEMPKMEYKAPIEPLKTAKKAPVPVKPKVEAKKAQENTPHNCPYCETTVLKPHFERHLEECDTHLQFYNREVFTRLDNLHLEVIKMMQAKSSLKHLEQTQQLTKKFTDMGLQLSDINLLRDYIEHHAPLIIHVHILKYMQFFVNDTHYRNQFETGKTSGCNNLTTRGGWETKMFDKKYDKAEKTQRPKYGTINFTNDPKGVRACSSYGPSYFLLKKEVRYRCTITDQDSCSYQNIGTMKFCNQVLNRLTPNEIKAALGAAKGESHPSNVISTYKEIQVHGPIEFEKDIEKLYVNSNEYKTPEQQELVQNFSKKFGVPFEVFNPT